MQDQLSLNYLIPTSLFQSEADMIAPFNTITNHKIGKARNTKILQYIKTNATGIVVQIKKAILRHQRLELQKII